MADNIQVLDATAAPQTMRSTEAGGVHLPHRRIDGELLPVDLLHGKKTLTGSIAETLAVSTPCWKGVRLKADPGNSGPVFVGSSTVTALNGWGLMPGEDVYVYVRDLATIFIIGTLGDSVIYLGS